MKPTLSLTHDERLRARGSIGRLFESGKSGFVYPLRYMWLSDDAAEGVEQSSAELLFTVPKRLHKRANKRNLLRRRIKESYRLQKSRLLDAPSASKSLDIAILYATKEVHSYKTIDNAVHKIINNIISEL